MDIKISRVFLFLAWAFTCSLLFPSLAEACECTSNPTCSGTYCYCACHYCSDKEPLTNPCNEAVELSFNASPREIALFKERIDVWSEQEDLHTVVEAATDLYHSVLFRDSQGFIEADSKLKEALNSLSEDARKSLIRTMPPQRQK